MKECENRGKNSGRCSIGDEKELKNEERYYLVKRSMKVVRAKKVGV